MLPVSKRLDPTSRENGSRGSATPLSPFLRTKVLALFVLSVGCTAGSTVDFAFEDSMFDDSMFDDAGTADSAFEDGKESSFEGMYEQWKASVLVDPALQIYAVGDRITPTSLVGEEEARRYFEATVAAPKLTLHNGQQYPGDPIVGSYFPERAVLRYCVDRVGWNAAQARFAYLGPGVSLFDRVADAFGDAASVWQTISGVRFVRDVGRDGSCSPAPGDDITWYITPYTPDPAEPLEYFAFVLRPHHNALGPNYREFLVYDEMAAEFTFVDAQPFINWFTLEGILLHTIGTGLGFVPESNRGGVDTSLWPATCRNADVGGIFLSNPDAYSAMTHPSNMAGVLANPDCAGHRPFDYAVTYLDAMGAACQYAGEHGLYFCSPNAQTSLIEFVNNPACSPVPFYSGATGDCGFTFNWVAPAREFEAALITALR